MVVVTTHLDEATAAAGGLVAALVRGGTTIDVLAVTDGDGALDGSVESSTHAELLRRRGRQPGGYRLLGAPRVRVHRLKLPSGKVSDGEPDVVAALSELLGFDTDLSSVVCLAPWERDGHPDHDAVGRAAELACHAYRTRLVRYLVAAWRWAEPRDLPWEHVRGVAVPAETAARKLEAVTAPGRPAAPPATQEIVLV
jgi:LmbE family N-acetylglucosaminyl deacetylase